MADSDLRDLLLRTTARLFQQRGYAAVTLRSIAAEAGVTTGSLYYYFTDKEQIVQEILDTGHRRIHQSVVEAIAGLPPNSTRSDKVQVAVRTHLAALFEAGSFPAANVRIYAHVPEHLRQAVRSSRRDYENLWISLLSGDGPGPRLDVEPRHLAMFLFGAANWTFEWVRGGRDSLDTIAHDLASLFLGQTRLMNESAADAKTGRRRRATGTRSIR